MSMFVYEDNMKKGTGVSAPEGERGTGTSVPGKRL